MHNFLYLNIILKALNRSFAVSTTMIQMYWGETTLTNFRSAKLFPVAK